MTRSCHRQGKVAPLGDERGSLPVSYTHLDVYKRQHQYDDRHDAEEKYRADAPPGRPL